MAEDFEEKPDERYWLEKGTSIITPEREAKADLLTYRYPPTRLQEQRGEDGPVYYARVNVPTVLGFLSNSKEIGAWYRQHPDYPRYPVPLGPQDYHNGGTYELWQTIFTARQGYGINPIYSPELRELRKAVQADGFDATDYIKVITALTLEEKRIIEFSLYTTITERLKWLCLRDGRAYAKAFDTLETLMEPIREKARRKREDPHGVG